VRDIVGPAHLGLPGIYRSAANSLPFTADSHLLASPGPTRLRRTAIAGTSSAAVPTASWARGPGSTPAGQVSASLRAATPPGKAQPGGCAFEPRPKMGSIPRLGPAALAAHPPLRLAGPRRRAADHRRHANPPASPSLARRRQPQASLALVLGHRHRPRPGGPALAGVLDLAAHPDLVAEPARAQRRAEASIARLRAAVMIRPAGLGAARRTATVPRPRRRHPGSTPRRGRYHRRYAPGRHCVSVLLAKHTIDLRNRQSRHACDQSPDSTWNGRTSIGRVVARAIFPAHSSAASRSGALMIEIPPMCSLPSA
jgi:hypothetical protein